MSGLGEVVLLGPKCSQKCLYVLFEYPRHFKSISFSAAAEAA